ncbi:MAG TPA: hypothetical protein VLA49_04255 [Anaerolineales bacterium]|nr:hypothetical protein [Anaerolineales bacterium]
MSKRPLVSIILLGCLVSGVFSPAGRQPTRGLAQIPLAQVQPAQVPLAIEGQIAYVGTDGNLWVLRQGESVPLPVTSDANPERVYLSPRWSPDGSLLAFCRQDGGEGGRSGLYFARTGEWQPFPLVEDVFCNEWLEGSFTWSPDGRRVVYARNFVYNPQPGGTLWESYYGLWSVDLLTGEASEFVSASNGNPLVHPQYSPDGRWLKFYEVAYIEGLGVLQTVEIESSRYVNWVGLGADIFPGFSSWSPDGSRVVFDAVSYTGFPGAGVYFANPDGSDITQVFAQASQVATLPLLSPRQDRIAFLLNDYGKSTNTLVVIAPNGEARQDIASSDSGLLAVDWSPAGNQLLYAITNGENADLVTFDVDTGAQSVLAQSKLQQADWGPYSAGSTTREALSPQTIQDVSFKPNLLIYLAEDYRLVLYDPSKERQVDLSPPMTVGVYQASPSRQGLVYRDRWLWLSFEAGGNLNVQGALLPSAPAQGQISWSPDETRLAMLDAQGRVWLAARSGAFVEIPGAASLPSWSFDGQWLSYCNSESALWLVGPGTPPKQIAESVECPARWSSRGYLLAYQTKGSVTEAAQVFVYDPLADKASFVLEGAGLIDWSPDGRVLALLRPDTTAGRRIVFGVEPLSGKQLLVGRFLEKEVGVVGWFPQSGSYLFGPFRLTPDLSSASRVSDAVFAATSNSGRLLVGIGTSELITLTCLEPFSGQAQRLSTANLAGFQMGSLAGIWAEISNDGEWAAAYVYDRGRYQTTLSRCDGTVQIPLSEPATAVPGEFSPSSQMYLERQVVAGASKLVVHGLTQNITQTLSTADHKLGLWLKPLRPLPPGGYALTGRVRGTGNRPLEGVTLLLDGLPAGISAGDGRFAITGLPPGEYTLSPQSNDYYFEPSDVFVRLPSEELDFDFSGTTFEAGAPPEDQQPEEFPEGPQDADSEPGSQLPGVEEPPAGNPFVWIPWICGGSLVLLVFLLFAGVIRLVRRRRKRQAEILPVTESAGLEDTAPVRVRPIEAPITSPQMPELEQVPVRESKSVPAAEESGDEIQARLGEGIQLVRAGELTRGAELLRKVVEVDAQNATAWMWLGWAAAKSGDRQLAGRCFGQAKKLGHPRAEQALTWLRKTG